MSRSKRWSPSNSARTTSTGSRRGNKMRITIVVELLLLTALCFTSSSTPAIAGSNMNFRQRASVSDEIVTADIAEEVRFGREVAARVIARFGLYDNPGLLKYVNLGGRALSRNRNRRERGVR